MSFFRLDDLYALRRYTNDVPLIVKYGNPSWKRKISDEEMELLKKCDGVNAFSIDDLSDADRSFLKTMISRDIVQELSSPLPLKEHRAYKKYYHKRIAVANWALTVRCNMNCLHCLNLSGALSDHEPEISLEDAKIIIDRLIDYGVEAIEMFGGEPTIYPHFMEIVRMVYEAGMQINSIDTNGMLITEKMLDEFKRLGAHPTFAISFDGLGTHEWMRNRKGCEETVKKAIKLCVDRGFKTNIAININKKTLPVLEQTIDYFVEMGCKQFKLLRTSESFRWQQTEAELGESLTIPTMEFASIMIELVKKYLPVIRGGVTFMLFNAICIRPNSTGKSVFSEIKTPPEKTSGWCAAAENGIFIAYNGHVSPCPGIDSLVQYNRLYCDEINLINHSLEEIVYGDFYRSHYRITKADVFNASKECQACDRWSDCNGGVCRMNATMDPAIIAVGAPPEKVYLCQKDVMYCSLIKSRCIDAIADILDGK